MHYLHSKADSCRQHLGGRVRRNRGSLRFVCHRQQRHRPLPTDGRLRFFRTEKNASRTAIQTGKTHRQQILYGRQRKRQIQLLHQRAEHARPDARQMGSVLPLKTEFRHKKKGNAHNPLFFLLFYQISQFFKSDT